MECRNCDWCNLLLNRCLIDKQKCYENGVAIKENCTNFRQGEWQVYVHDLTPISNLVMNCSLQVPITDVNIRTRGEEINEVQMA